MVTTNPKREALHQAGHLVIRNVLSVDLHSKHKPVYSSVEGHGFIYRQVCYWVAGGVAERVFCNFRGIPKDTTQMTLTAYTRSPNKIGAFNLSQGKTVSLSVWYSNVLSKQQRIL